MAEAEFPKEGDHRAGAYSGVAREAVIRRLGDNWRELADVMEVPEPDTRRFRYGDEPRAVLAWAERRDRASELPHRLRQIGREDLAEVLEKDSGPDSPPPARRRRWRLIAGACVLLLAVAGVAATRIIRNRGPASYSFEVLSDPESAIMPPKLSQLGGNYMTALPISQVPAPPDHRDTCDGRSSWAHRSPIDAVDAGASFAQIRITPHDGPVTVNGAELVRTDVTDSAPQRTLLACPGRGGNTEPHELDVDLDSGSRTFYPDGDSQLGSLNLTIERGETATIVVVGTAIMTHARWRLQLRLDRGDDGVDAVTLGAHDAVLGLAAGHPDQVPFDTAGELVGVPYRFKDGRWQAGR